ncbi:ABC transporter substrate-binding protein [Streptomyces sp. JJ36]|uniref:ABC transporter substrate-binding protein n=1 Tax=Streptomyces sp. JJ36 TaxID=2736645 RepID=UPI001F3A2130|nr:ABC transporter substrate-binding protein [Streptomyces sp. JJ36]MCF6526424.1 ABC transporter substrate-binding protein [Streptomyces sp. JJ36]
MTVRTTRRSTAFRLRIPAVGAIAVAGALLLSGCGDQTDDAGDGGGEKTKSSDAPLFDRLPKKIQDAGVIKVGSDIAYAPVEFVDENNEPAGIDPDLAAAMGEQLGVEFEFKNATFDQLVLGMNSGRYDIVMSAMTDTKQRQQGVSEDAEGGADFVDYFKAGSSILVAKGNPEGIKTLDDLCGKTVAAQRGTANEALVKEQSKKCDEKIDTFISDKDTDSITQLQNKRADAVVTDFPVAAYNAKTFGGGNQFEVVGDQIDAAPYGIAVGKKNTELRDAIQAAMNAIMENGEYEKVLKKWDVTNGALPEATINAGT